MRLRLTKTDLDRIPDDERFFYFMAGDLTNDTNILSKLLITAFSSAFARPGEIPRDEPHNNAGLAQLFLVLKLLSGRLHEANSLISSHYFGKGLHKKYENEMSERAQDGRRRFSVYFGGEDNIITKVRNKFAFHFSRPEIEFTYHALPKNFEFIQFLGGYIGHNLFVGSTILSINAMTTLVEGTKQLDALDRIYKDTTDVAQWLMLFLNGYMQVMINKYLRPIKRERVTNLVMPAEPPITSTTIPFFSDPPLPQQER
jgi:hypothetical protein